MLCMYILEKVFPPDDDSVRVNVNIVTCSLELTCVSTYYMRLARELLTLVDIFCCVLNWYVRVRKFCFQ